jgi:AraC family transcriptional regulator
VILREMPPIWDEAFRPRFYARWGRENCIISARTRHAEYPPYRQCLSVKAAWGGTEEYFVDGRRIAVDDDTFMILNDGRTYASRLRQPTPVHSFSIFFRPGMAQDVARTASSPERCLLDDPAGTCASASEFGEHVRRHDHSITPLLRYIHHHVEAGVSDENWYDEQLHFLLHRMLAEGARDRHVEASISATRASTRKELHRRIGLAVDFINTHFAQQIGLAAIASAALLSPYHCLRTFRSVHGRTPATYLCEKRVQVAHRLLQTSDLPLDEIAAQVGFQSRSTLFRQMRRALGAAPAQLRCRHAQSAAAPVD